MQENNLNIVVVPQTWLQTITEKLEAVEYILTKKNEEEVSNQWIESTEVRKLLKVSSKTWQTYRDERRIPFSQFGRKIYVKRADLDAFMQEHYITARHKKGGMA